MAAADVQQAPEDTPAPAPSPGLPDYVLSPNAVLGDKNVQWRYGRAPDYSKTRKAWEESKIMNHQAQSLPQLVENLIKNWEVEASFKPRLADWRTVDHKHYSFAINGGKPQSAEHMLKVGTYNAIISANDYYSPAASDFASSHKTFKRMMPTFAFEVIEVYSGPPHVAFKWRHWGTMKNDYVGFNDKGEKVTAKAHGGVIDIVGITTATVNDALQMQKVDTYFDPLEMFRQIAPEGIVNKEIVNKKVEKTTVSDMSQPSNDGVKIAEAHNTAGTEHSDDAAPPAPGAPATTSDDEDDHFHDAEDDSIEQHLEQSADIVHPHPKDMESLVHPEPGQAVAAPADSEETRLTQEEMSRLAPKECPFMMNRE